MEFLVHKYSSLTSNMTEDTYVQETLALEKARIIGIIFLLSSFAILTLIFLFGSEKIIGKDARRTL